MLEIISSIDLTFDASSSFVSDFANVSIVSILNFSITFGRIFTRQDVPFLAIVLYSNSADLSWYEEFLSNKKKSAQ